MRDLGFMFAAFVVTWLGVYFALAIFGIDLKLWVLIATASLAAGFAALLVLLGESIIEDIVKVGVLMLLSGILWATSPGRQFIFVAVCVAAGVGVVLNQVNNLVADKSKRDGS